MIAPRYMPLVLRTLTRQRTRMLLTLGGVATAMFLFCGISALSRGVAEATEAARGETRLIVYRANRFCPFTSRLPEHYTARIGAIHGVVEVVPTKIVVNNCRAGLDVVTFRGMPRDALERLLASVPSEQGAQGQAASLARSDAAIVGAELAARRRLRIGDRFDAAGITVSVAGILDSPLPQERNSAVVDLAFLQQAAAGGGLGVVTQFTVSVDDPDRLNEIARAIDAEFSDDPDPTSTRSEQAFVAAAARDIVDIVRLARWLGWACVMAVLVLIANAVVLAVQDRIRDHAVMQTLGFRPALVARLVVVEALLISVAGGALGGVAAWLALRANPISLSMEGVTIDTPADWTMIALGLGVSGFVGIIAAAIPAWQAGRRSIVEGLRT